MGNASSGGTANVTTGMSGESYASFGGTDWTSQISFSYANGRASGESSKGTRGTTDDWHPDTPHGIYINLAHTHNVYLRGSVSLGNGDSETRPVNYTMRIWKRIS